ncbi:forkhead box protein fkh-2-like [Hydractinia symbiolongicarpus]|uniref:forkhead box protein fkh-2-like n=1 Tax=Hydractinia symbiolongicarpus TaxID=13093 RepID=UPI00254C9CFC|nr:forkhead box protein fkh-2-like [Hydractinia symbiolongicarpus]
MKLDMSSMSPSLQRQFSISPTPTVKSEVMPSKKPTFFSIDQILGKHDAEGSDDEVFVNEYNDDDSYDGDKSDVNIDGADIEMSSELDENNNEIEKISNDKKDNKNDKQTPSYTAIIAQAILSSSDRKLPLGCIYEYIAEHFPEFLKKGQGWRNCVRHNLSLSECFIKAGRARNGRGNYWGIHPRYIKNFSKGDFRKRRASHRPRNRDLTLGYGIGRFYPHYYNPYLTTHAYNKSLLTTHRPGFSVDNILSKEHRQESTPPILSSHKFREASPHIGRSSSFRLYSPPVLSSVVPASYLEHYNYRSYDHGHTTAECSCQSHKFQTPRN